MLLSELILSTEQGQTKQQNTGSYYYCSLVREIRQEASYINKQTDFDIVMSATRNIKQSDVIDCNAG